VIICRVDRQADDLDIALGERALKSGQRAKLGGTDRCEILGMREQVSLAGGIEEILPRPNPGRLLYEGMLK